MSALQLRLLVSGLPLNGPGDPEPRSRRVTDEHRLVYLLDGMA
ncbi:type II toxin-antitoxin system YoeB family toxin [Sinomonas terrae]|uniref:Type II toxin-antitoxin system YoeB family toxin n=1 Tax=Sinomonas terrae TaxID=2908838 RepID=A0ABS9TYN2_9MICC|nr:type II toxin-antitoxin system YoeB family toxin [Sinomonas terrae]MCH6469490.1 type II toxin-antitoxin system YoeB family toxin [Sinomonas terrae]